MWMSSVEDNGIDHGSVTGLPRFIEAATHIDSLDPLSAQSVMGTRPTWRATMDDSGKRWLIGGAVVAVLFGPAVWQTITKADEPSRPSYQPTYSPSRVDAYDSYDSDYDTYNPGYGTPAEVDPGDIDCADVGHEVYIDGDDPYYLDADNDGVGCEGW
jgi:hypothetical protein